MNILLLSSAVALVLSLSGCGAKESNQAERDGGCSQKASVVGASALGEMNAMVGSVALGSRCQWSNGSPAGTYRLNASGRQLTLSLIPEGAIQDQNLSATRTECNGVPYWRAESGTATVDGNPASLLWDVREDTQETVRFVVKTANGESLIDSELCK